LTRLSPPDFSKPFAKAVAKRLGASRCADWFVMGEEAGGLGLGVGYRRTKNDPIKSTF
jgi:hypothetical protein